MRKIFAIEERDHHTLNLIFDEGVRLVVSKTDGPFAVGDMYGQPEDVSDAPVGAPSDLPEGVVVSEIAVPVTEAPPALALVEPKPNKKK